jgi:DAACS family dicarboxylate/amino acid:cation (Na+ or H+) symporter
LLTNLNNDGIVLYEALAVFFVAQLAGIPLTETQMISAAFACIVAAMGITGIPEAGFISLSVVVATMGLPLEALPLLLAVDRIIARGRSGRKRAK